MKLSRGIRVELSPRAFARLQALSRREQVHFLQRIEFLEQKLARGESPPGTIPLSVEKRIFRHIWMDNKTFNSYYITYRFPKQNGHAEQPVLQIASLGNWGDRYREIVEARLKH